MSLGFVQSEESDIAPNMNLAQYIFEVEYLSHNMRDFEFQKKKVLDLIQCNSMAPLYLIVCSRFCWELDEKLYSEMKSRNAECMRVIDAKHADALERAGDMEVMDTLFMKAKHFAIIGDFESSIASYDVIIGREKTSTVRKIDAWMAKARIFLFTLEKDRLKEALNDCKKLVEQGGDWDRRNRLKVYEALYLISSRELKASSLLLRDCIATFSCTELCSYPKFMSYAIVTNILTLSRTDLHKDIVKNPQVISVVRELPEVYDLLMSVYSCDYGRFFDKLTIAHDIICMDRYLSTHSSFVNREFRVLVYSQFLEAYKSVTLSSMAASLRIDASLLDCELSRFISSGRLNAKIDKVGDIIETCRPDKKNHQYQEVIKKGDVLLNSIQKLARMVDV